MDLAKINRGLIVSFIFFLAIMAWLIGLAALRQIDKPAIRQLCRDTIAFETKFALLPQPFRDGAEPMGEQDLSLWLDDLSGSITALYVDQDVIRQLAFQRLANPIRRQAMGLDLIADLDRSVLSFADYSFDGQTVTVTIETLCTYQGPSVLGLTAFPIRISQEMTDTIILQKEQGSWRVLYADVALPVNNTHIYP